MATEAEDPVKEGILKLRGVFREVEVSTSELELAEEALASAQRQLTNAQERRDRAFDKLAKAHAVVMRCATQLHEARGR